VRSFSAPKADVWALGVLMHAMLFGFFPFDHEAHPDPNSDAASMDVWLAATKGGWRANPRVVSGGLALRISGEASDFLDRLLTFDECRRPDVEAVLAHPWMRRGGLTDAGAPPLPPVLPSNDALKPAGTPPPPPAGLLPLHAEAWRAMRAEQRELDKRRALPQDELGERRREQALLAMLALSARPGAPGDALWRIPLSRHAPVEAFDVPRAEDKVAGRALGKVLDDQGRRQERLGLAGAQIRRLSCEWPRKWAQGDGGGGTAGRGAAGCGASAASLNSGVVAAPMVLKPAPAAAAKPAPAGAAGAAAGAAALPPAAEGAAALPPTRKSSAGSGVIGRTGSMGELNGA